MEPEINAGIFVSNEIKALDFAGPFEVLSWIKGQNGKENGLQLDGTGSLTIAACSRKP